jgi:hypothetical protein
MRITIEPTQNQYSYSVGSKHPVVVITLPDDDMCLPDVLECLVMPALLAYGFRFESIEHTTTP